jgi:polar amino acid transport system permease protein
MCPNIPVIHALCQLVTLNGTFRWAVVPQFIFNTYIIQGLIITVILAVLAQTVGTIIGLILYFLRRARFAPFRWIANAYILVFRGTPLLLQIFIADVFILQIGLFQKIESIDFFPAIGFPLVILELFVAVLAALSLNEGAYMAEIVRAGIDSIDVGQMEAAKSLGMTYGLAMRRIILPQAARVIIPPLGNEFNSMLKNTSLGEAIGLWELANTAYQLSLFAAIRLELLIVAAIWYLVMTTVWTFIQAQIERRLNVSVYDAGPTDRGGYWQRLLGFGGRARPEAAPAEAVAALPPEHRA